MEKALVIFRLVGLLIMVICALWDDLQRGRISNTITYPAIVLGLGLNALAGGMGGVIFALLGIFLGAGPFLVLYLTGLGLGKDLIGGGDVKLMAAIGAFAGPLGAVWTIYYALWVCLVFLLAIWVWHRLQNKSLPRTMPFGSCLALGVALALALQGPALAGI